MRWNPTITFVVGLAAGAATLLLLPESALFRHQSSAHDELESTGERWACAMMDYIGNRPGDCPVCGMKLQRVTSGELTTEQKRRLGLTTALVQEGPARVTVRAFGVADYDHRHTQVIIPRIGGRIVKRYEATEGCCTHIHKGDPIIDFYSEELIRAQGELVSALGLGRGDLVDALRERFARWNLVEVADNLIKGGAIAETVTLRSPFAGQALLKDFEMVNEALEVGREFAADTPLLRIVDPSFLVVVAEVSEAKSRFLAQGQSVELELDDVGTLKGIKAVINRVGTEILPDNRSRELRIYLEGAGPLLSPGALVGLRIKVPLSSSYGPADPDDPHTWGHFVTVPKTAILSTGVRHLAWRVSGKTPEGSLRFEPVALALGPRLEDEHGQDRMIVRAGLRAGDEVAVNGLFLIDSQAQLAGTPSLLFPAGAAGASPAHQGAHK